ncbi:MAG TPA: hypothetical protein DCS11_04530 [Syntrophus sp. (in: bacteria)]|jgi:hypothetical protein|nr:GerMN domain-containing protein [Smithellaceae bacterium]HAR98156.1 hypothetical protein [Syntrophus sp. (in: bacteria)]
MSTKKQRRIVQVQQRKKKQQMKTSLLVAIVTVTVGFLILFFVTLFHFVYPPAAGRDAAARSRDKVACTLYFNDANERFLVPEKRFIPREETRAALAEALVKSLIEGSKTGLTATLPGKAGLRKVEIEPDQTVSVSFAKSLPELHPGSSTSELATVYSLTNTLMANMPEIKRVRILVGDEAADAIRGHVSLKNPFAFNQEIIAPVARAD